MSKTNPHILFVDDQVAIGEAFCHSYTKDGYGTVVTATCSDQAFECLKRDHFDLVITGIIQLELDGLEMTAVIRDLKGPPVIVLTGFYDLEVRREAYEIGAMAFLSKPTPFRVLAKVVRLVVEHGLHFVGPIGYDAWEKEEFQWAL